MKKETTYKVGDIVMIKNMVSQPVFLVKILNVFNSGYEWEYYPKQSDNCYHTDYACDGLLYEDHSTIIDIKDRFMIISFYGAQIFVGDEFFIAKKINSSNFTCWSSKSIEEANGVKFKNNHYIFCSREEMSFFISNNFSNPKKYL